jgi:enoyl-CoA hydratase
MADHEGSAHGEGLLMLVLVEVDDRVATVTLNRPEARNAISSELHRQLEEAVTALDSRDDIGCMVLTGADPAFCAGMDLKSLATERRSDQQNRQHAPLRYIGMLPPHDTPIIGAINGPTVTGGLELAMCCDFLIASERARFADTHARVGAMPGGGMSIRLPQLIGIDRARRMSFTGDYIDAETARDWGLVVEVVPHESLLARARELAATIASVPAETVRELRRMYDEIGALTGREAWVAESAWSRRWMAEHFDQARLSTERENIVARGRAQATGPDVAPG